MGPSSAKYLRILASFFAMALIRYAATAQESYAATAPEGISRTSSDWAWIILSIVFLIIATAASGWYFGNKAHRVPFLIGLASFSAACGVGIGLSFDVAAAAMIPALAAAYGGALVCAVNVGRKNPTIERVLSNGSAASGIPLMLGAYFGISYDNYGSIYADPRWLLAVILLVAAILATSILVARCKDDLPLPLAGGAFGAFIGLTTGLSQTPVVGYVAPAALALFAGVASCSFAISEKERPKIGGFLLTFGMLLIIGLMLGAVVRQTRGWDCAPRTLFAFGTILLVSVGFGAAVGKLHKDAISGLGFAVFGAGVGLAIGMSQTPVMYVVGPALLTMVGALTSYVFIADKNERMKSLKLLAAFGVVVLLGSYVGYSLRQGDFRDALKDVKNAIPNQGIEVDPGVENHATALIAVAEQMLASFIWLEGSENSSAICVQAGTEFQGLLTIEERVDGIVLYSDHPSSDGPIKLQGESLRIRWPVSAGRDALSIQAWERMVRVDDEWTVEGDGELLDLNLAEVRGDEFVLEYPP
jgi:MFS family permease